MSREILSRSRLIAAALELVQSDGLAGLTMRGLAARLGVKAASLYWHVRDRDELVELLAQALLDEVRPPRTRGDWRIDSLALCGALERLAAHGRDAARILLEAPEVLEASDVHGRLRAVLETAELSPEEAREAATMMLVQVLVGVMRGVEPDTSRAAGRSKPASVAIDTGSRGVTLRAGSGSSMSGLIRVAHDPTAASPALIRGDTVIVRRRRGSGHGELELNPAYEWRFRVQAPTWNTVLNLPGLDVREIQIDSGATRVECVLPAPRGVVPINVSGGVVGVKLRRPPGVKVVADISTAAVQLRLDDFTVAATTSDVHWESAGPAARDYYLLRISGGAVRVSLEADASIRAAAIDASARGRPDESASSALNLVLDGVASRQKRRL